jgi:hypothetical protein
MGSHGSCGSTVSPTRVGMIRVIVGQELQYASLPHMRGDDSPCAQVERTVYTPLFSGVLWDRQDYMLEDIDRIEVISGPGGGAVSTARCCGAFDSLRLK